MLTIAAGVFSFTLIVLSLVLLLIVVKAQFAGVTSAQIVINDNPEYTFEVTAGKTLLFTLADHGVFVPSACGGKGTCGTCKLVVKEGGGGLLPTEASLIKPAEARKGVRLACQIKVRADMSIVVPEDVLSVQTYRCRVRSNENVATFIKELVLEPEEVCPYEAGGYVQLVVPAHTARYSDFDVPERFRGEWERLGLFKLVSSVGAGDDVQRAYSVASYPEEQGILTLNIRIALPPPDAPDAPPGKASSYAFMLKPGDPVTVAGPFGDFRINPSDAEMVFVGGGAGMAPLRSMIFDQLERVRSQRKISYFYGARSLKEAFYVEDFERLQRQHDNFRFCLALSEPLPEDHWQGDVGNIHSVALDGYLKDHPEPEEAEYYLCGPPLMLRACLSMLDELGVPPEHISYDEF